MSELPSTPYEQLLALGVCELELAGDGRLDELAACQQARAGLMATLGDTPPSEARDALERCLIIERHLEAELRQARAAVLAALRELQHARRAADGYTPARQRMRLISTEA